MRRTYTRKPKELKMVLLTFMLLPANVRKLRAVALARGYKNHDGGPNLAAACRELIGEMKEEGT